MTETRHILIVDDDREIRTLLGDFLQKNGYRATAVADGKAMRRALEQNHFDLIVLDLMLPGEDGLKLTRELRAHSQVPIIMLTALGEEIDRVVGLEVGADDYLSKPFSPRELVGRVKAILRRTAHMPRDPVQSTAAIYRFGDWQLDVTARSLTHGDGSQHSLSGAEFRLLAILLAHPTRVLSRSQLMELLRGRDIDPFDRSVDVRISRLRQVLRDDARSPKIIKTVYGEGYVMGVPVEQE
ncbi:response regulator [Steroidobacter sp.]|uniref:response regulator n=1 Tax=Steroidobacter sp. TaxID=1978227 RepID=UPI001A49ADE2|nr:response regulator [Steroidobacter sp.]MBL8268284.1 response regulator [Steroidobacter sp.]